MILRTNVKLNLGLRVLGRRADGYHDLETRFVPCDAFGDMLEVEPLALDTTDARRRRGTLGEEPLIMRPKGRQPEDPAEWLEISGPEYRGWNPADDLVAKAWRLLHDEFGIPAVKARLEKKSPVGAGLGGGSADGAFMLKALNEMFSLGLSEDALAARAAHLGSDCAFFAYNRPMFATGRGEILEPFDIDLSAYRFEIAIPEGVSVSTREAYAGLDAPARPDSPARSYRPESTDGGDDSGHFCSYRPENRDGSSTIPLREALKLPIGQWRDAVVNDFERSVFPLHPEIAALKAEMYEKGAIFAAMTGSGSAVFGIFSA